MCTNKHATNTLDIMSGLKNRRDSYGPNNYLFFFKFSQAFSKYPCSERQK